MILSWSWIALPCLSRCVINISCVCVLLTFFRLSDAMIVNHIISWLYILMFFFDCCFWGLDISWTPLRDYGFITNARDSNLCTLIWSLALETLSHRDLYISCLQIYLIILFRLQNRYCSGDSMGLLTSIVTGPTTRTDLVRRAASFGWATTTSTHWRPTAVMCWE